MTRILLLLLTLAFGGMAAPVFAQAYVPLGFWTTADNSERLLIQQDTTCSFFAVGGAQVAGNCVWQSSSRGGILTLWYSAVLGIEPIYYNVVWVDERTITVEGDVFYLRT